mmetsp:Transcript_19491/g.56667  ORF Transcript_19491/g.56667 Transcript_19491/m.56667 type:complete len:219 (+) Transcript_19491:1125-1781(+)
MTASARAKISASRVFATRRRGARWLTSRRAAARGLWVSRAPSRRRGRRARAAGVPWALRRCHCRRGARAAGTRRAAAAAGDSAPSGSAGRPQSHSQQPERQPSPRRASAGHPGSSNALTGTKARAARGSRAPARWAPAAATSQREGHSAEPGPSRRVRGPGSLASLSPRCRGRLAAGRRAAGTRRQSARPASPERPAAVSAASPAAQPPGPSWPRTTG